MNELAFFRLEGEADSDVEIPTGTRRGMISFPRTLLLKVSTPYMRSGVLYGDFKRAFGQNDPNLLFWKASSALMNPMLREQRLAREKRLDATRFARVFEAEFTEDVDAFLPHPWVDEAVRVGRHQLPPQEGTRYIAAIDPSGGGRTRSRSRLCMSNA